MGVLNVFSLTVWATPLILGMLMRQRLRGEMRRMSRVVMWLIYATWGWGWVTLWYRQVSGGSGRYAFEQMVFISGVLVTTVLGGLAMALAEDKRRRDTPEGPPLERTGGEVNL